MLSHLLVVGGQQRWGRTTLVRTCSMASHIRRRAAGPAPVLPDVTFWASKIACAKETTCSCLCGLTGGVAYDRQGSAHDSAPHRQGSAKETQGQEEVGPAGGATQHLHQAVHAHVVESEGVVRLQMGAASGQHVARRVEFPPTPATESEGRMTSGERMQHVLFGERRGGG